MAGAEMTLTDCRFFPAGITWCGCNRPRADPGRQVEVPGGGAYSLTRALSADDRAALAKSSRDIEATALGSMT